MRRAGAPVLWGVLLVVAGVLFLLQNLGVFGALGLFGGLGIDLVFALLFAFGGVVFLSVYARNREQWWPLIPGMALIGIGGVIFISALAPGLSDFGGAFFLGCLALAFLLVYATDRTLWWAIIPGGVLLTLAVVAGIGDTVGGIDTGALFFVGLGVTFLVVSLIPTPEGRMRWALIPAGVMLVLALVVAAQRPGILAYLLPAAAILGGLYLLMRALSERRAE
ncbi:MAG: hypothetical protein ACYC5M_18335 [Anaerolineae bacterium]